MIIQMPNTRFIYGDICRWVTEEINQYAMIKYLLGKHPHWIEKSGSLVTSTLKLVHGWQNDGQQKELFYEDGEDILCPAGCGQPESKTNFIRYTARHLQAGHIKRRGEFKKTYG